jgi:hypothetical protein
MFRFVNVLSRCAGVYVYACFVWSSDRSTVSVDKSTTLEVLANDIIAMVMDAIIASQSL